LLYQRVEDTVINIFLHTDIFVITKHLSNFDVLLTLHLRIFILEINQLDAKKFVLQ